MTKIGLWTARKPDENPDQVKKKLRAAGCSKVIQGNASELSHLGDTLQAGDCVTVAALTDLDIRPADLIELLEKLNRAGITLSCLDPALTLPTNAVGEQVLRWVCALESLRSVTRSRAVKTGIARAPSRRKLTDKAAFLADAKRMSQVKLAKHYGISLTTARKYLAEWQE